MRTEIRKVGDRWVLYVAGHPMASARRKETLLAKWPGTPVQEDLL